MCSSVNVNSVKGKDSKVMEGKDMFKFDNNMKIFGEKYDESGKFWFEDLVSRADKIAYVDNYNCDRLQSLIELGDKFLAVKASLVKPDGSFKVTVLTKWLKVNDVNGVIKDKSPDKLTYCLYEGYMQGSLLDYPNIKSASHWSVYDGVDVVDAHFNNRLWVSYVIEQSELTKSDVFSLDYVVYKHRVIGINPYTSCSMTLSRVCNGLCVYDSDTCTYVKVLSNEDVNNLGTMLEPAKILRSQIKDLEKATTMQSRVGITATEKATSLDNEIKLLAMQSEYDTMITCIYREFGKSIGLL